MKEQGHNEDNGRERKALIGVIEWHAKNTSLWFVRSPKVLLTIHVQMFLRVGTKFQLQGLCNMVYRAIQPM